MDRLTKRIALVLVSSSLAMFGCTSQQEAEKDQFTGHPSGTGSLPGTGSHSTHSPTYSHGWFNFFGGSGSSFRSGGSSFSSHGGSSRGGFGASAHGGGS